jgi:opacity protein-like surface antigen
MKRFILLSVAISFSVLVNAQKVSGGLSFSPILSWVKTDNKSVETDDKRLSFGYGAFIDYNFTDNFSLSTGINVNELGGKLKYNDSLIFEYEGNKDTLSSGVRVLYKTRYVEIPISIKGKTNEIGYLTYFMKAGISPMFRWKASGDIEGQDEIENVNIKEEVRLFNLAFHVGAGFEYSLGGNTSLITEVVYYNGLADITPDSSEKWNDYNVLTHQFMLKVGIKF